VPSWGEKPLTICTNNSNIWACPAGSLNSSIFTPDKTTGSKNLQRNLPSVAAEARQVGHRWEINRSGAPLVVLRRIITVGTRHKGGVLVTSSSHNLIAFIERRVEKKGMPSSRSTTTRRSRQHRAARRSGRRVENSFCSTGIYFLPLVSLERTPFGCSSKSSRPISDSAIVG
jgi:hypothetical protein